jgi:hypothetical protein
MHLHPLRPTTYSRAQKTPSNASRWRMKLNPVKVIAALLIVGGVLGLAYGGFSYTKQTHEVTVGPVDLSVRQKETFSVPVWVGVGAILVGGVLLLFGRQK